jgi:hypothetical protein
MSIKEIDILFLYLYGKNENYTGYEIIQSECFPNNPKADVEGMTLKMYRDNYLDCGALENHQKLDGYFQKGNYKLSFAGRLAFEKWNLILKKQPYRKTQIMATMQSIWAIAKTMAAISVTVITVSIAILNLEINKKAKLQDQQITDLKHRCDSLQNYITSHRVH